VVENKLQQARVESVVCQTVSLLPAPRFNCSLGWAMDSRMDSRCGIISSCQSAATWEIVKRSGHEFTGLHVLPF